jgi:hypothetical protein
MASIAELCWNTAEDLFQGLDFDDLYTRQVKVMGTSRDQNYPYMVVVYTGKITIGLNLGRYVDPALSTGDLLGAVSHGPGCPPLLAWIPDREPSE